MHTILNNIQVEKGKREREKIRVGGEERDKLRSANRGRKEWSNRTHTVWQVAVEKRCYYYIRDRSQFTGGESWSK